MRAWRLIALVLVLTPIALAHTKDDDEAAAPPIHPAMRVGVDYGRGDDGGNIFAIEYRLMQHDLAEPFENHAKTSLGELLKVRAAFLTRASRLRIDELTLLRMLTVPPINGPGEKELAWKVRVGFETVRDGSCNHCLAGVLEAGVGAAVQLLSKGNLMLFATVDVEVGLAPPFANFVRLGGGPAGGLRWHPTDALAFLVQGKYRYQLLTPAHHAHAVGAEARWRFAGSVALRLKGDHYPDGWEGNGGILYYF